MKGFTLIETLIAVLLLALAIASPLTIASRGLGAATIAKDQFVAFFLAQDAMEQIRFLRDSACLGAVSGSSGCPKDVWLSSLSACKSVDGSTACYFDSFGINPASPTTCTDPTTICPVIRYTAATQKFDYNSSGTITPQQFVRVIRIQHAINGPTVDDDADEAIVTVTVSWKGAGGVARPPVTVRENIFRWQ